MYESLRRAAFTAIALSAAAWTLFVALGRELVQVPVAGAASTPAVAQTLQMTSGPRAPRRHDATIRVSRKVSLPLTYRERQ